MITTSLRGRGILTPLLTVALLGMWGCSDDSTTPDVEEAPEIPPVSTFLIDFSDFTQAGLARPGEGMTTLNWGHASFTALVWNAFITIGMAVPVATFVESFNHVPVQTDDGSWLWSYSVTAGSQVYRAKLYGTLGGTGTTWRMYVSKDGMYEDFLWYSGEADLLLTQGSWTLNRSPEQPNPLIEITWHRNSQQGTGDIRYTNVEAGNPENGGYIFWGTTTGADHAAFYDVYNKGADNHTEAEWDPVAMDGRVSDPNHFGDEAWHCWDTDLQDTECP